MVIVGSLRRPGSGVSEMADKNTSFIPCLSRNVRDFNRVPQTTEDEGSIFVRDILATPAVLFLLISKERENSSLVAV